eukprot:798729-Pleurochrysis_carterae.AAC.1
MEHRLSESSASKKRRSETSNNFYRDSPACRVLGIARRLRGVRAAALTPCRTSTVGCLPL